MSFMGYSLVASNFLRALKKKRESKPPYSLTKMSPPYENRVNPLRDRLVNEYNNKGSLTEADRNMRRVKKDKAYARMLNKKLKPVVSKSFKTAFKYINNYNHRKYIHKVLFLAKYKKTLPSCLYPSNVHTIPISRGTAEALNIKLVKRGSDWCAKPSFETMHLHEPGFTTWKNYKAVSYTRAKNINYVKSLGLIVDDKTLIIDINDNFKTIVAPDGYSWGIDSNGIKIVNGKDDYHIDASDVLRNDALDFILSVFNRNKQTRIETEIAERAQGLIRDGVYVCFNDSLRAGNCFRGTLSFIENNNLDSRKHYSIQELINKLGVREPRLKLALTASQIRHKREMEIGYSLLEDHRFQES